MLVGLTLVVLGSSVFRLSLYTSEFGLSRLRVSAYALLLWVGLVLVLVVVSGIVRRFVPHLPRTLVVLTGALAVVFVLAQPDALIARVNLARAEAGQELDAAYLSGLSADAVPVLAARDVPAATCTLDVEGANWNLARWRALRAAPC